MQTGATRHAIACASIRLLLVAVSAHFSAVRRDICHRISGRLRTGFRARPEEGQDGLRQAGLPQAGIGVDSYSLTSLSFRPAEGLPAKPSCEALLRSPPTKPFPGRPPEERLRHPRMRHLLTGSPKAIQPNADTKDESVKFGRAPARPQTSKHRNACRPRRRNANVPARRSPRSPLQRSRARRQPLSNPRSR